jgi:hypothetical protein
LVLTRALAVPRALPVSAGTDELGLAPGRAGITGFAAGTPARAAWAHCWDRILYRR